MFHNSAPPRFSGRFVALIRPSRHHSRTVYGFLHISDAASSTVYHSRAALGSARNPWICASIVSIPESRASRPGSNSIVVNEASGLESLPYSFVVKLDHLLRDRLKLGRPGVVKP